METGIVQCLQGLCNVEHIYTRIVRPGKQATHGFAKPPHLLSWYIRICLGLKVGYLRIFLGLYTDGVRVISKVI